MERHDHVAAPGEGDGRTLRCRGSMDSDYSAGTNTAVKTLNRGQRSRLRQGYGAAGRVRKSKNRYRIHGAALMLSLWALFLLSAMVISWALEIDSRLALSGHANRTLEA